MNETAPENGNAAIETLRDGDWRALPDNAAQVYMIAGTVEGLLIGVALAAFIGWPLLTAWSGLPLIPSLLLMLMVVLVVLALGIWRGYRRWKYSQWKLDDTGLHVKRGRIWRREILVPRSRVQHLDIERGPIERHFGLATLIVHTAWTRVHALRQTGFLDADAVALRDALVPDSNRHDDAV